MLVMAIVFVPADVILGCSIRPQRQRRRLEPKSRRLYRASTICFDNRLKQLWKEQPPVMHCNDWGWKRVSRERRPDLPMNWRAGMASGEEVDGDRPK